MIKNFNRRTCEPNRVRSAGQFPRAPVCKDGDSVELLPGDGGGIRSLRWQLKFRDGGGDQFAQTVERRLFLSWSTFGVIADISPALEHAFGKQIPREPPDSLPMVVRPLVVGHKPKNIDAAVHESLAGFSS